MSRSNRLTDMVFSNIIETHEKISQPNKFLAVDQALNISVDEELRNVKNLYKKIVDKHKTVISDLAKLEETIVQLRCKEMVLSDFKLSIVCNGKQDYVYARAHFFRPGKDVKDIRVVVGPTDVYGSDLNDLQFNGDFQTIARAKLTDAMIKEIKENLRHVDILVEKYS